MAHDPETAHSKAVFTGMAVCCLAKVQGWYLLGFKGCDHRAAVGILSICKCIVCDCNTSSRVHTHT